MRGRWRAVPLPPAQVAQSHLSHLRGLAGRPACHLMADRKPGYRPGADARQPPPLKIDCLLGSRVDLRKSFWNALALMEPA